MAKSHPSISVSLFPLHPSPFSLAVSSLSPHPPSLHPSSFLSQMGLCKAEGHRNVSLTYTQSLSLGLFPLFPSHTCSLSALSHTRMHTLLNVSSSLSLPSQSSLILSLYISSTAYSTYIILFGQAPWADIILEVTDFGLWPKTAIPRGKRQATLSSLCLLARHFISAMVAK